MQAKTISKTRSTQPTKGFFFKRNPQRQHSFFESAASNKFFGAVSDTVYRKCDECANEDQVQRKTNDATATTHTHVNPHTFLNKLDNSGQALPREQQHFFGQRMNFDFGEVKIHTGKEAAQSASAINAQAYTYQNHIVFNENKYQPSTSDGKKLLSHELVHVTQQLPVGRLLRQEHPQTEWIPPDVGPGTQQGATQQPPQTEWIPPDVGPGTQRGTTQQAPQTEWIPPDIGPVPQVPESRRPVPLDPVERERMRTEQRQVILGGQDQLAQGLIPFIVRNDAAGLLARLRSLDRMQALHLLISDDFIAMVYGQFQGTALWAIFSILFTRGNPDPLFDRLNVAILSRDAQMTVDLIGLLRSTANMTSMRRNVLRTVLPQIFGGSRFLPEMLELLQEGAISARQTSFDVSEVHYEDVNGQMELQRIDSHRTADYRTTATQMRVVVPMNFVQPSNPGQPFNFIGGALPSTLETWLSTIRAVWNNQFYLYNGHQNLQLVFIPIAVHGGPNTIAVHTDDTEICPGLSQPGRSGDNCFFTSDSGNVIAHEFGHLIGAADEYNLPSTAAEIPATMRADMSPEDIRESTVEGISRTRPTTVVGGHDIPDSVMSNPEASQHVYARHVQRLVNAINAQLPAGVPPYQIRRPGLS